MWILCPIIHMCSFLYILINKTYLNIIMCPLVLLFIYVHLCIYFIVYYFQNWEIQKASKNSTFEEKTPNRTTWYPWVMSPALIKFFIDDIKTSYNQGCEECNFICPILKINQLCAFNWDEKKNSLVSSRSRVWFPPKVNFILNG